MKSLLQELRDNEYILYKGNMGNNLVIEYYQTDSGRKFALHFSDNKKRNIAKVWSRGQYREVSKFYRWRIERAMRKGAEKE